MTGEGGHVSMAAATREEQDVIALLRDRFDGHCSAERVLSGPGLVNLYVALAELAGRGQPTVTPEDVTNLAKQGEPLARKTLAHVLRDARHRGGEPRACTTGARGGVYIAGGIVPRLVEQLRKSEFRARFEAKGRYRAVSRGDPDARHHGAAAGVSRAAVPARLSLALRSLALGVLDPAALLGRLLIDGLLNAFRAVDRARQRIEHRFAPRRVSPARSRGSAGSGAAAAGERERESAHHKYCFSCIGQPSCDGTVPRI